MKLKSLMYLTIIILLIAACSKGPAAVLNEMKTLDSDSKVEEYSKYYTKESVEQLKKMVKLADTSEAGKYYNSGLGKDVEWDVIEEKINDDEAEVKLKFVKHPEPKVIGMEMIFRFKKEGSWKIDMARELKTSMDLMQQMKGQLPSPSGDTDKILKQVKGMLNR